MAIEEWRLQVKKCKVQIGKRLLHFACERGVMRAID